MPTPRPPRDSSATELEAFETACRRLNGFDEQLGFEWIDGFLASLAAAPALSEPDDWLPAMAGDAFDRAFADPPDRAQALAALQARLAVLRDQLDPEALLDDVDALRLEPLMSEVTDDERQTLIDEHGVPPAQAAAEQTGALWATGFLSGVRAMPGLWERPTTSDAQPLFAQAFAHVHALLMAPDSVAWKAHTAEYYPPSTKHPPPTRDDVIAEACMAVQDLRLLWVDFLASAPPRRAPPVPGRNDPCFCGSGKKYKKCHGA